MDAMDKLNKLSITEKAIDLAVEIEELSLTRIKTAYETGEFDKDEMNTHLRTSNMIIKKRINQRNEVSINARIIKDMAGDKEELKLYITATFPSKKEMLKREDL